MLDLQDQFERLRIEGREARLHSAIVARDVAWTGSINPMVARHGGRSAARQFSGRAVPDEWARPFRRGAGAQPLDAQRADGGLSCGAFAARQMDS